MVTVALGLAGAVLILFQADLLSRALAGAARGTGIAALSGVLAWLGVVVACRAAAAAGGEAAALRAAAAVKSGLRRRLSGHVLRLGPQWLGGQPRGEITTLATRGLDGLDAYFARYLPRLSRADIMLRAVSLTYPNRGRPALDEISLTVRPGEHIVLTGPSGAGRARC